MATRELTYQFIDSEGKKHTFSLDMAFYADYKKEIEERDECEYEEEDVIRDYLEQQGRLPMYSTEKLVKIEPDPAEKPKRTYAKSGNERKPSKKERKVDAEKKNLITALSETLQGIGAEIKFTLTETEVDFEIDGVPYTMKLTKHRKGWVRGEKAKDKKSA